MIKLKSLLKESTNEYKFDWIERHRGIIENGKLIAYHGTPKKNLKFIKENGFKPHSYFSLRKEYSRRIASIYQNIPENKIIVLMVKLPLDSIDFVASDIFAIKTILFKETQ